MTADGDPTRVAAAAFMLSVSVVRHRSGGGGGHIKAWTGARVLEFLDIWMPGWFGCRLHALRGLIYDG